MNKDTPKHRELPPQFDGIPSAHERRARVIAELHAQAVEQLPRQRAAKAGGSKDVRRRKAEAWMIAAAAFIIGLGCVYALSRL
jgi:hypothetical protein